MEWPAIDGVPALFPMETMTPLSVKVHVLISMPTSFSDGGERHRPHLGMRISPWGSYFLKVFRRHDLV